MSKGIDWIEILIGLIGVAIWIGKAFLKEQKKNSERSVVKRNVPKYDTTVEEIFVDKPNYIKENEQYEEQLDDVDFNTTKNDKYNEIYYEDFSQSQVSLQSEKLLKEYAKLEEKHAFDNSSNIVVTLEDSNEHGEHEYTKFIRENAQMALVLSEIILPRKAKIEKQN